MSLDTLLGVKSVSLIHNRIHTTKIDYLAFYLYILSLRFYSEIINLFNTS
jgi:hypothetical protein